MKTFVIQSAQSNTISYDILFAGSFEDCLECISNKDFSNYTNIIYFFSVFKNGEYLCGSDSYSKIDELINELIIYS